MARTFALSLVLAALSSASAAQDSGGLLGPVREANHRPLRIGSEMQDSLAAGDPQLPDNSHFHSWRFTAAAGQQIVATMSSPDFSGFLMLVAQAGDSLRLLESESDLAGGSGAQIATVLTTAGEYLLVANTLRARQTGAYSLSLRTLEQACAAGGPCALPGDTTPRDPITAALASARPIALGESRESELTEADPLFTDGSYFHLWRYQGTAGERIVIDHSSTDFDAYLVLGIHSADSVRQINRNDDGPSGLDSQLAVELPETGTYVIVANTFRSDQRGSYRLTLRSMADACAAGGPCEPFEGPAARTNPLAAVARATPQALGLGQNVAGRLAASDPSLSDRGAFHAYRFTARAGDTVAIHLTSTEFDPYLYLARASGQQVEQIGYDDDSGGGRNSLITAQIDSAGEYLVVATGFSSSDTGSYALTLQRMADACSSLGVCEIGASLGRIVVNRAILAAPARAIALGARVAGELANTSATLPEGRPFDAWRYSGRAGERLLISQRSTDFDAYLYLYRVDGSTVDEVARNDDDGGDRNAEINTELSADGEYLILAAGFGSSARGSYELLVQPLADACAAGGPCSPGETTLSMGRLQPALAVARQPLNFDQPVTGRLEEGMPTIDPRGAFQTFSIQGAANQRVVITMDSEDFDPYLYLARQNGQRLRQLASDDDGGPGTNSRLVTTLPESGEYVVIAAAYSSTGTGGYTVAIRPCDDACAAESESGAIPVTEPLFTGVTEAERRTLPADGVVESELLESDPTLPNGTHFHSYRLELSEGTAVSAEMTSSEVDPYLSLLRVEGDSLVRVAFDDDGGEGVNSLLEWTADASGTYILVVHTFGRGSTGPYTLRVQFTPAGGVPREASRRE